MEQSAGTESSTDNPLGSINIGMPLPVTSGIDPSVNTPSSGTVSGSISVPSVGDSTSQQQPIAAQPHHIQLPGAAMSIGSIAMAMGLSGGNTDPNSLTFTSNALATLTARMGMSSVAGSNSAGLVTPGNSLVTFPTNTALNLVPGVSMNLPGAAGAGVSIVDGGGLSMAVAGGMAMHTPGNVNVVGVAASNDLNSNNIAAGGQQQSQQQGQHNGGAILHNNIHLNAGGSNLNMVNNLSVPTGNTPVTGRVSSSAPVSSSSTGSSSSNNLSGSHTPGSCCGGCKTRVTVKDQYCQTDLSTVLQVKTEERLARSGLMPGARLISSHGQGSTVSHANPNSHHGPNVPCSCDFCGRMFAKKEYLRRHVRIHTGERPYKCVICGHSFRRSHHLRCHELTHTGTKPYTCGICGKAFNLSHHLRRHEMTHTGEKPYACSECGKAFTRKQHLDRHYKTHTGEYHRTFKCPFCEKMFYRAHHRDKHMKRHGEVLTTPDLTVATFSPVSNMNLSIRPDGTLRADGLNSSPISVGSKDDSHSSEDYLTSDEDGNKIPNAHKPPKEGSKKRKGSSPMRLRFPYDYNAKDGPEGMKLSNVEMNQMKNMGFTLPHGTAGPSHIPSSLSQSGTTILSTPTRGRPKGSKNKVSRAGKKNSNKGEIRPPLLNPNQLGGMEMKTERMDIDRDAYGGVVKKDEDNIGSSNSGGMYGGKAIPNIPQQFVSESVVVRHPLQGVGSPHNLNQQQPAGAHGDKNKTEVSTPGPMPTPTQTPTPDGRGGPMQWPNAQQVSMTQSGNNGTDYMPGLARQLHTPGPAQGVNPSSNGASEAQQTCHYKPPSTPDQNLHHSWSSASAWPRLSATSDMTGPNAYGQMDASRFMNLYNASKVMEMRMSDLRAPHGLDGSQWNQGRRDPSQEKGTDNRIYNMHQ